MNIVLVACTAAATLVLAAADGNVRPGSASTTRQPVVSFDAYRDGTASQQKGRYKKEGDNCVWAANDGGPNQCTPITAGRFKRGTGDACTWDANDHGRDQCKPAHGRWKKGNGDDCTWDANDSGPNQCNPRRAKAAQ